MREKINQIILRNINESINLKTNILNSKLIDQIEEAGHSVIDVLNNGGKVFFAGNGGSFADSQHLAAEFISRFLFDRNALPAIALATNNSSVTAIGNDYDFENIFSREIFALGSNKDIFFPITTSGNSKNLINAVKTATDIGLKIVALTGATGGALEDLCDCIKVPSTNVPRIQECHIMIGHLLCQIAEKGLFKLKN
ncbi:SIS domain-containing protein [Alphaproteobacteria bacterium]|nr:SIS domain-containing protein [Alphaproteobacteria bacterium]